MGTDRESDPTPQSDIWLSRGAILVVIALQTGLASQFAIESRWLAPALEVALLIPLVVLTTRSQFLAAKAAEEEDWTSVTRYRPTIMLLGIALLVVVSVANSVALLALVQALLAGHSASGRRLLLDAVNIWTTNVIVFALWYWVLDRGGPSMGHTRHRPSEFIFPHMTLPPGRVGADVFPGFVDYLYLSFTTSTALSPTDTLPLTSRMKLLMMLEAMVSLMTIALVTARAVNILA